MDFPLSRGAQEEFTGRRSAQAIADWARSKIGSALQLLKDSTELRAALQRGAVSAVVARGSAALKELLQRLAERHRAWGRFLFLPAERPSVQVHRGIDEVVEGPEIDLEREGLEKELWEFLEARWEGLSASLAIHIASYSLYHIANISNHIYIIINHITWVRSWCGSQGAQLPLFGEVNEAQDEVPRSVRVRRTSITTPLDANPMAFDDSKPLP